MPRSHLLTVVVLMTTPTFAGCISKSPTPNLYLLTPLATAAERETSSEAGDTLWITAVELPKYLSSLDIVQTRGNRLVRNERERWGEPLRDNFARVLAKNLTRLAPGRSVSLYPWEQRERPDRELAIAVERFDVEDGRAILEARWSLRDGERRERTGAGFTHAVEGDGYDAMVAALSATLASFAHALHAELAPSSAAAR